MGIIEISLGRVGSSLVLGYNPNGEPSSENTDPRLTRYLSFREPTTMLADLPEEELGRLLREAARHLVKIDLIPTRLRDYVDDRVVGLSSRNKEDLLANCLEIRQNPESPTTPMRDQYGKRIPEGYR